MADLSVAERCTNRLSMPLWNWQKQIDYPRHWPNQEVHDVINEGNKVVAALRFAASLSRQQESGRG